MRDTAGEAARESTARRNLISRRRVVGPGLMPGYGPVRSVVSNVARQETTVKATKLHDARKSLEGIARQGEPNDKRTVATAAGSSTSSNQRTAGASCDVVRGFPGQNGARQNKKSGYTAPGTKPEISWCPPQLSKAQKRRIQRLRTQEKLARQAEEERDRWFNQARPMSVPKKTRKEKRIARGTAVKRAISGAEG